MDFLKGHYIVLEHSDFKFKVLTFWFKQIKKKKVHLAIQENLQE